MLYILTNNRLGGLGEEAVEYREITASALNVRETPSTSAKILNKLTKGTKVVIVEKQNGFGRLNGVGGWIALSGYTKVLQTYEAGTDVPAAAATTKTSSSALPSWIPEIVRSSLEATQDWVEKQVLALFGNDEQSLTRTMQSLQKQYDTVAELIKSGKIDKNSLLYRTQSAVGAFLSQLQKFIPKDAGSLSGLGVVWVWVGVIVSGLIAGAFTLNTLKQMKEIEAQRETELQKVNAQAYDDLKAGKITKETFAKVVTANKEAAPKSDLSLISDIVSNLGTVLFMGAAAYMVYSLVKK